MKSILDPSFVYTSSVSTDLRKSFAKVRERQAEAQAAETARKAEVAKDLRTVIGIFDARRK